MSGMALRTPDGAPAAKGVFTDNHYSTIYPPGIEHHFWNLARNWIIASTLRRYVPEPGHMLEIGCGTGVVVAGLRRMGFDCQGCDLGTAMPAEGAEGFLHLGQDCLTLDASFRENISTLLLLDVIEHVEKPVEFMVSIRKAYPNASTLLITVPARQELWSNYDVANDHFRRYDPRALKQELIAAGFAPRTPRYFFHALYPVMRLQLAAGGGRTTELKAPGGFKRLVHRVMANAFWLEAKLAPGSLVGTSLLAVATVRPAQGA